MKIALIILAIYVALDIISGVAIYLNLRLKGWSPSELAWNFRKLMKTPCDDFIEELVNEEMQRREEEDLI